MLVVAIVDDDRDLRESLGRLLTACGYEVLHYRSAEDFLAEDARLDCLVLDVQLPGLSGLELAACLRAAKRVIPLVFITGHEDPHVHELVRATAVPWLRKPFDEDGLLDAISKATAARR